MGYSKTVRYGTVGDVGGVRVVRGAVAGANIRRVV